VENLLVRLDPRQPEADVLNWLLMPVLGALQDWPSRTLWALLGDTEGPLAHNRLCGQFLHELADFFALRRGETGGEDKVTRVAIFIGRYGVVGGGHCDVIVYVVL
jgi:hypothetical protein